MTGDYHVRGDHLRLIARTHVRHSLRSGSGVIFLVLSMLVGLILAAIALAPLNIKDSAEVMEAIQRFGPSVLDTFLGADKEQARYLLADKPALVSLFFVLLTVFLPFIVSLGSFNQTSGDIGSKGLRYLLLRTERANVYLGRLIGTYLFTLAVITLLVAVVGIYFLVKVDLYSTGDIFVWMLRCLVACALYALPWVALCAWLSAALEIPFLVLLIAELGTLIWVILVAIVSRRLDEAAYAAYATPWGWKWWLFQPSVGTWLLGALAMVAFAALFAWLGLRTFHRRDM